MRKKNSSGNANDKKLVPLATEFIEAFLNSVARDKSEYARIVSGGKFGLFPGGIVELSDELEESLGKLVGRAAAILGAKAAHENAISQMAMKHAQLTAEKNEDIDQSVAGLIKEILSEGDASYAYLAPNYLVRFEEGVSDIKIGPVRAMLTDKFLADRQKLYEDSLVEIVSGGEFKLKFEGAKTIISMRPLCWLVDVDAARDNIEEEAKWLIDIAISYLRLSYLDWLGNYPHTGKREPHPMKAAAIHKEGVTMQGSKLLTRGSELPCWYEISANVQTDSRSKKFEDNANMIFNASKGSLAERVGQGLGWLTRGRQAEDRAERLLYFFTAIEALLSGDDKAAPVVQTIARHAAVILTNDNEIRRKVATEVKRLYGIRSSLVHTGKRSVLFSSANAAQVLAENLFDVVLEKASLQMKHVNFNQELSSASYGESWPSS